VIGAFMKKGFTLIELIITIAVMVIVSTFSMYSFSKYNKIKSEINIDAWETIIFSLINNSKQYCRERNKSGYIYFDLGSNRLDFYSEGRKIEGYNLTSGLYIYSINTDYSKIDINRNGITSDAGTITLKDKSGKVYTLTISVGTGYVEIK
jgi:prepilin-type N-terminal cleavage/methylation domain-containing protein